MAKTPQKKRKSKSKKKHEPSTGKVTKKAKPKKARKKSAPKKRPKQALRNDRAGRSKRIQKKGRRDVKRTKPNKKSTRKNKVSVPAKRRVRNSKGKGKGSRSKAQIAFNHPRRKHQIELAFKNVRKIERKIELVADSEEFETLVERQLTRKNGRPPRGFIIIVEDNEGHVATRTSSPSRHVDAEYVIGMVNDLLEELKDNYDPDLYDAEEDGSGFSHADPNRIYKITIKFFYGK